MSELLKKIIVRSIDIGYGNVKSVLGVDSKDRYKLDLFPSIAIPPKNKINVVGQENQLDTILVDQDGVEYEVGHDIHLITDAYSSKNLNRDYILSNQYAALCKGALRTMKIKEIDLLVLGTPVYLYDSKKDILKTKWKGEITLHKNLKINIKEVIVIPQTTGGYMQFCIEANCLEQFKNERNLIIDIGYYTVDWMIFDNLIPISHGSYEAGMAFYLKAIVDQIGLNVKNLKSIKKIDESITNGTPFKIKGKIIDLISYFPAADKIVENAAQTILNEITDLTNVDNIIVIGGPAKLYIPILKKHFQGYDIKTSKNNSFANVMGYQALGNLYAKNLKKDN